MIKVKDASFSYGENVVLKKISLDLEEGRIYGLLGENGVGKTTLLTLLCGLKKLSAGTIDVDGIDPYRRLPDTLSSIYYLPDDVLPVQMKPEDFAVESGQFWPGFSLEKFRTVMDEFECPKDQRMDKMSCGQLKKTYIAFALATNARYLFMDEPTNGLDIPAKAQFRSAVTKHTSEDSTLVISTHQVRDLESIIDPVVILDKKEVLLNASVQEISEKLYFDYSSTPNADALYSELLPGSTVQVLPNATGEESKVSVEALFNAAHKHKDIIKTIFSK